jgi:hypothetical protein
MKHGKRQRARDGAQQELRPTGRARLPPSRDFIRVSSVFHPWPQSLSGAILCGAFPLLVAAEVTRRILLSDPPIPESSLLRKLNRSKLRQQRFDSLSPFPPFAPVKCVSLASAAAAKGVWYRGWALKSGAGSARRAIRRDAEWMRPGRSRSPNRKQLSSCGRTRASYRVGHGAQQESGARLPLRIHGQNSQCNLAPMTDTGPRSRL